MTALLLLLVWLLAAPVVALLVGVVCRGGGAFEDGLDDDGRSGAGAGWATAARP